MNALEPSGTDWANTLWNLMERKWVNHIPSGSNLAEVVEISKTVLAQKETSREDRLKIALCLIDAGKKVKAVKEDCKFDYKALIKLAKTYLITEGETTPSIKIAYTDKNTEDLVSTISQMLLKAGYKHNPAEVIIKDSQKHKVVFLETDQGKKFIKINKTKGGGLIEHVGASFGTCAQAISSEKLIVGRSIELLVQPYIPIDKQESQLFHAICKLEAQDNPETWKILESIFIDMFNLSYTTMHLTPHRARNDEFLFKRLQTEAKDGVSGLSGRRIEDIYKGVTFKLMDLEIPWDELKTLKWTIDGVEYQETLDQLMLQARQQLDPSKPRLVGISHGDGHENNIFVNGRDDKNEPFLYKYIDLEYAGVNDLIGEAALFLMHTTVYADSLNQKYSPQLFEGNKIAEFALQKSLTRKTRNISISKKNSQVQMNGVGSYGTLESRVKVARLFIDLYYMPLVRKSAETFQENMPDVDSHLKYALFLRLLGGRTVSKYTPLDQAKIISLIYKSLGTPTEDVVKTSTLTRFMDAL